MHLGFRELLRYADTDRAPLGVWVLLLSVAWIDGKITRAELEAIERCIRDLFPMDEGMFVRLREQSRTLDGDPDDLEVYGRYVFQEAGAHMDAGIIQAVREVAWADGRPGLGTTAKLIALANAAQLSSTQRRTLLSAPTSVGIA